MKKYRNENAVNKVIDKTLKELDIYYIKYVPVMGRAGVPDYILNVNGIFVGLEAKRNAKQNPPTALQNLNLLEISKGGGISIVVDETNVEKLKDFLEKILVMLSPVSEEVLSEAEKFSASKIELKLD